MNATTTKLRAAAARVFPDPRYAVLTLLVGYLLLGFTLLGFNRNPAQAVITSVWACALEFGLGWIFFKRKEFPLSALITSCGLSILLNYSHNYFLLFIPVFFAIGSKYVFRFNNRHVFNPAMIGVVLSLLFSEELITSAPAYQWNGVSSMAYFILFPALMFFMPSIDRTPLVVSFLLTFTGQVALRAWIMRHHLPFATLFWGTLSSPAFLLFTFFMITDPATSPKDRKQQIRVGIALALVDLAYHLRQSYYTFFYASFTVAAIRLVWSHGRAALQCEGGPLAYAKRTFLESGYYLKPVTLGALALAGVGLYRGLISPSVAQTDLHWHFVEQPKEKTGIDPQWGYVYERLDPRAQHIAKWLLSIGEGVSSGDFDGDGKQDLFFSLPLKADGDRGALYRNLGDFKFERVRIPALEERAKDPLKWGLPTSAVFVDYDNDGDLDLLVTYAFGSHGGPILLKNMLKETGKAEFVDVTEEAGLSGYSNSVAAVFADFDRDGRLDLYLANVIPLELPDYDHPARLDLFNLPKPEYPGDRRPVHFMHDSWNRAFNGGKNYLFLQKTPGHFVKQDSDAIGLPQTGWSLAVGSVDFNHDGWPDIYVANDFGPDDLYYNEGGTHFRHIQGSFFGSIGRDTYKGMNVSIGDLDRNGWQDVYVSNVHHDMQAEGSLLWMWAPPRHAGEDPVIEDRATQLGALNERRFGWGASIADFDNDGWRDIAQTNGMVDDSRDKKWEKCPDYWYINEKLARSAPSIHSYADSWGDIRGTCIHPREANRLYLNRGRGATPQFVDVAERVGLGKPGNARAVAATDLDNDGRLDLVITHLFDGPQIFRNVADGADSRPTARDWIGFELESTYPLCNRQGIGSEVKLSYTDGSGHRIEQVQVAQTVTGMTAQNDGRLHFGLGTLPGSDISAEVNWCLQWRTTYPKIIPGQINHLRFEGPVAGK